MTAERYTPDELPGVIANWREAVEHLKRRMESFYTVSVDELDRLLATVEAMAGDVKRLEAELAECKKYEGTTWD